jgi:hypothetical protein
MRCWKGPSHYFCGVDMRYANIPQSTDSRIVSTSRCYVVFDKATGDVIHIHHSVEIMHGAPAQEDAMKRARRLAGRAGVNAEVIEVETALLKPREKIRIDPAKRKVILEKVNRRARLSARPTPGRRPQR